MSMSRESDGLIALSDSVVVSGGFLIVYRICSLGIWSRFLLLPIRAIDPRIPHRRPVVQSAPPDRPGKFLRSPFCSTYVSVLVI